MENVHSVGAGSHDLNRRPVREEFWNLPNTITSFRLAVVPILMLMPFAAGALTKHSQ